MTSARSASPRSRWVSPARSALTVSFLLVPAAGVPPERWGWLPLATGLAAAAAVRRSVGVQVGLKWPNDVLAEDGRKLGGILLERVERDSTPAAVIGIGLNCTQSQDELPVPEATSLALAGAAVGAVGGAVVGAATAPPPDVCPYGVYRGPDGLYYCR